MENFFDESVFLVHTALTGLLYQAYRQCKSVVAALEVSILVKSSGFICFWLEILLPAQKLPASTYEVGRHLNSALEASSNGTLDYAAVYGRVQALGDPLQSSNGRPAVIRTILSVDHFRNKLFTATWYVSLLDIFLADREFSHVEINSEIFKTLAGAPQRVWSARQTLSFHLGSEVRSSLGNPQSL